MAVEKAAKKASSTAKGTTRKAKSTAKGTARKAKGAAKRTTGKARSATRRAKSTAGEVTTSAQSTAADAAAGVKSTAVDAAETVKSTGADAASGVKDVARRATATTRATLAARAGKLEEAQEVADEAGLVGGPAASAIAKAEAMHYQVEVNKRRFNAGSLSDTLNERWENGWRLAHVLEQRGNTVLVFEKRD